MVELAKISHGNTVLIHAGAGGVGSLAIQLARRAGAHVMTTARQSQAAALRELGAERVIDYTRERFEENIKQVDAVLDLVGKDTLARSYALVKPGGFIITANQLPDTAECARLGIHGAFVHVTVTTQRLNTFAALVADGQIKPQIAALQTIWSPATLWAKRDTGRIGKVVFAIRS
jgi:NADPH:quinone reductase-like Zn-dependent oxidoreductase